MIVDGRAAQEVEAQRHKQQDKRLILEGRHSVLVWLETQKRGRVCVQVWGETWIAILLLIFSCFLWKQLVTQGQQEHGLSRPDEFLARRSFVMLVFDF